MRNSESLARTCVAQLTRPDVWEGEVRLLVRVTDTSPRLGQVLIRLQAVVRSHQPSWGQRSTN